MDYNEFQRKNLMFDLFGDSGTYQEQKPDALEEFFRKADLKIELKKQGKAETLNKAEFVGLDRYAVSETHAAELNRMRGLAPDPARLEELASFLKATKREVEGSEKMTKAELHASIGGVMRKFASALGA